MALNPRASPFLPFETEAASLTGSRIGGGSAGHQQQRTESESTNNCIDKLNNNAILQQSLPPRNNESTLPSADGGRSAICQRNVGNNIRQLGNNKLAAANNNTNNENNNNDENTEQNRTGVERPVSTSDHHPRQQINNTNNIGSVPSSSSAATAATALSTIRRGLSSIAISVFSFSIFGSASVSAISSTAALDSNSTSSNGRQLTVFCAGSNASNNNATYQTPTKRSERREVPPAAPNRTAPRQRRRRVSTNALLSCTAFENKRISDGGIKRTRQSNGDNVDNGNGAKRSKHTERVEVDTTALDGIHRAKQQRRELLCRVRANIVEHQTSEIETCIDEWKDLKDTWVYRDMYDRRGVKRKFDDILDTSSTLVSTVNRELLRFALKQSEGYLSRREVYDIVERSDGTFDGVRNYIETRISEYKVVQSSRRAPSEHSNPLAALTLSKTMSSSSTNRFEILADTAIDEEEDDTHVNNTAVNDSVANNTAVDGAEVDATVVDGTRVHDTTTSNPRRSRRPERKANDIIVETVVDDEDTVASPRFTNKDDATKGPGPVITTVNGNETTATEESSHDCTASEGTDAQLLIFDCDYVSKMLQKQPKLLAMLKVAQDEYKYTKKGLRETFCRQIAYELFQRDDILIIRGGGRLDYTYENHDCLADIIDDIFCPRNKSRHDLPIEFAGIDVTDHPYEELFPSSTSTTPVQSPVQSTPRRHVQFASDIDTEIKIVPTGYTDNVTSVVACWTREFYKGLGCELAKPVPKSILRKSQIQSIPISNDFHTPELNPNLITDPNLVENTVFLSDEAAISFLDTTYTISPSEAAEAAAERARQESEEEEEDDDDVAEEVPLVKDRGYRHASLRIFKKSGEKSRARAQFVGSKKEAGCVNCETFDLATEAALYADCVLLIKWYRDGDNMVFNFDTMRKFGRHHSAELSERNITKSLSDSIESVCSAIESKVTGRSAIRNEVLQSLRNNVLCWENNDDESSGDDEPSDDESSGDDELSDDESSESEDSSKSVKICAGNSVFQAIYEGVHLKTAFSIQGVKNSNVCRMRTKGRNKCITSVYNAHFGLDPNDATHFMNESGYVSSVHEHHLQHDGYTAYEGKEEDIQRTKKEIAWRKRVTHQMRGLHLALVHDKIRAYEQEKVKFTERIDDMKEFWKWMETKRTDSMYVTEYHDDHQEKYCTFIDFKNRVENDTGLKWEELADWCESDWKRNINRKQRVGILAYRILKRLDPGCSFCYRLISSYTQASQLYGWHGDHERDKIDDPNKVAKTKSIPELLEEMKKCRLRCWFCHDFDGGGTRSWEIVAYTCQLDYPVGVESKPARNVFNMHSFQALLWDIYIRGGYSGRRGFMPFSYDTLEMMVWQHVGIALEDLVTWPPENWETTCKKKNDVIDRWKKLNTVLYYVIKSLSGRCPNPHCLPSDRDFVNVSAYHKSGVHMDHVYEGGENEGEAGKMVNESLVTFLNEICGYTWATCCFCHGIKTHLSAGIEQIYCKEHPGFYIFAR